MPSGRTKKVCGGPLICSADAEHDVGIGELRISPGGQLREFDRQLRSRIIMINPDDPQIGLVRRGHLGEVGRFLSTGSAPLRPDIDHHRLPAQSGEPNRTAAAKARQDHIGESGRDRGHLRIRRRTVGNAWRPSSWRQDRPSTPGSVQPRSAAPSAYSIREPPETRRNQQAPSKGAP